MHIRPATRSDHATLVRFNLHLAQQTEGKQLDADVLARGVHAVFDDAARGRYLVAVDADVVLGALLITTEWSDWRCGEIWWIQSVYVEMAARGRGVYSALHQHVAAAARDANAVGLRLYVEPHNSRAIATYAKLGMKKSYDVMEA